MKVCAVLVHNEPVRMKVELRRAAAASSKACRRDHRDRGDEAGAQGRELRCGAHHFETNPSRCGRLRRAQDPLVVGSVEYAAERLGSILVMVLGHESCGAVKAAVATA